MKKKSVMSLIRFLLAVLCLGHFFLSAQTPYSKEPASGGFTVIFYNAENFFDTIDDPHCNDSDFLPGSKNQWNAAKYKTKLFNISKVLYSADSVQLPALIGLAEIENQDVLEALVATPLLSKGHYRIIHDESCDPRCIDVALLYRPDVFREISHCEIPVYYADSNERSARECLYVCGIFGKKDTLHLIVNHWKSRSGGTEETEQKRISYAQTMRHRVDSLFRRNPASNIILMGDFNDTPSDQSIDKYLNAKKFAGKLNPSSLYNITAHIADSGQGSHYYKSWELFDQIMVSTSLLSKKKSGMITSGKANVFKRNWMLYKNSKGEWVPDRTYASGKYHGGYSDHLPVMVTMWILR